jgi:hypothetical protein
MCLKLPQGTQPEMDKAKENQSTRNLQGKRQVELLIDRAQSTRREKWEIKAGRPTKFQDKIPSESPLGKMLRYWDDSPCTKGKKKQRMVKYCGFIWTQELILKPLIFLAKIWV